MRFLSPVPVYRLLNIPCLRCGLVGLSKQFYSLEAAYTDEDKEKIINTLNESDKELLSRYDITKSRIKYVSQWKTSNGTLKTLSDVELIEGFSEKTAKKLFDSILRGPVEKQQVVSNKIKGQILQPNLSPADIKSVNSVLTVYTSVRSVSWALVDRRRRELARWGYRGIEYPDGKKLQIADILDIAWDVLQRLPRADVFVMKGSATTLRAPGADPDNPRALAINLQKAQLVAMLVALISAREQPAPSEQSSEEPATEPAKLKHKVYFLRPTLPYRLYGTLVGNERVSTDQTVEMILQGDHSSGITIPQTLKDMFRSQKELEKDMLGHCLLLSLTFMDLCIYKDEVRIAKLLEKRA